MKKFELTTEFITNFLGIKLFRIKALVKFGDVKKGELGGFVEKEENLEHYGNAWVYGDAQVYGNAKVSGNQMYATIKGFGSNYRDTTFFVTKDGNVCANCGCFSGTLEQFRKKVKETHKDTEYAKEYLAIADLMEMHFKEELEKIKK
jgi:hypothetical protein